MPPSDLQSIAEELAPTIQSADCVAWIGSGLSASEYPGWSDLVDRLCEACGVPPLPADRRDDPVALMDKAQECKDAGAEEYRLALRASFPMPSHSRLAYHLLQRLPFKGFVTTNFDPLLSTFARPGAGYYAYPDLPIRQLEREAGAVFYMHGYVDAGEPPGADVVLARSDFEAAYDGPVRDFVGQLLYYPIIFVGSALREPAIAEVFQRVHKIHLRMVETARSGLRLPTRLIVLPTVYTTAGDGVERDYGSEAVEEQRFKEIGIRVVRYDPHTSDHSEIEELLRMVGELVRVPLVPRQSIGLDGGLPR